MLFVDTVKIDSDLLDFCLAAVFIETYKKQTTLQNRKTQRKYSLNNIYPVQCKANSLQKWVPK